MGILPKPPFLKKFTKNFENVKKESENNSWHETLEKRVKTAEKFYKKPELFDNGI